jgi:hypothetical protein
MTMLRESLAAFVSGRDSDLALLEGFRGVCRHRTNRWLGPRPWRWRRWKWKCKARCGRRMKDLKLKRSKRRNGEGEKQGVFVDGPTEARQGGVLDSLFKTRTAHRDVAVILELPGY